MRKLFCLLAFGAAFCFAAQAWAARMSEQEFLVLLKQAVKEHPEIVLDVLRAHDGEVFSIAQGGAMAQKRKIFAQRWSQDAKQPKEFRLDGRAMRGNADAPVTLVAYSDFTCPYCAQASRPIGKVREELPGTVRYVFKTRPSKTHPGALLAAQWFLAAAMQDQAKAWRLYDAIFADPAALNKDPEEFLRDAAKAAGLDASRLEAEAQSKKVQDIIAADREEADRLGVSGTPYLFVNDLVIPGAPDERLLRDAIQEAQRLKKR